MRYQDTTRIITYVLHCNTMRWWDIAQQYQWANSHLAPLIECWDIAHKWDIAHLTLVAADWDIAQQLHM